MKTAANGEVPDYGREARVFGVAEQWAPPNEGEDGRRLVHGAAFEVTSLEDRQFLLELSRQRCAFARILSELVVGLGAMPRDNGASLVALRHALRSIRSLFGGAHAGNAFRECARMEAGTCDLYVRALRDRWPAMIDTMVNAPREAETDQAELHKRRGQH